MFELHDIETFLKRLKLTVNEENIKWAYKILIKEKKLSFKMEGSCCDK